MRPHCRQALRPCPRPSNAPALRREALGTIASLADIAASLDVEHASYFVGRTYAAMLPEEYRTRHGVYYTPPAVTARLLDSVTAAGTDWTTCRALDPACGGGAFLGPLARRMAAHLQGAHRTVALRNLATRLAGYELDPFAAWLSQVFLDATLNDVLGFAGDDSFNVITIGDSLQRTEGPSEFDLVIGNPPYGRVKLPAPLRKTFKRSLYGHANLYGLFLDLAVRKARPGALIAYVTPTSFLCGEYFKNLRSLLVQEAPPVSFDFIASRAGVFDDVLQETLLATFRRGATASAAHVHFADLAASLQAAGQALTIDAPPNAPWILPRAADSAELAARLRTLPTRLRDWGYGVSTGPLVWNRHKSQLRERASSTTVPLIWAESVNADGHFTFRAARRNHSPYFAPKSDDSWLIVRRPCVLLQRTTAKEQPRRLIAAELPQSFLDQHPAGVTVENHLNMILPLLEQPPVSPRALAAFLNSAAADRAFRCISGTVAVSAYELESMPLPPAWALRTIDDLLGRDAPQADIEGYCHRLYGNL
jgi:adenine-specific DNA-methyltransferase